MNVNPNMAITIARQMGSGGTYIGYMLAKELGFKYVDYEILREAAKHLGTDPKWLEQFDGRTSGLLANILRAFAFGTPAANIPPLRPPLYEKELFTLEGKIMQEIVDRHSAVFVGRGSFYILRNHPHVFNVFVHAPLEFRIQRMMQVRQLTNPREARALVEESDQQKTMFIRDRCGVHWSDARNYDLCIDTSIVGIPTSVEMLIKLIENKVNAQ
jgi:CMP/dCMP kinase